MDKDKVILVKGLMEYSRKINSPLLNCGGRFVCICRDGGEWVVFGVCLVLHVSIK